ncbi:MAG: hypothetical protein ACSW8F_01645, partial [bacterium]
SRALPCPPHAGRCGHRPLQGAGAETETPSLSHAGGRLPPLQEAGGRLPPRTRADVGIGPYRGRLQKLARLPSPLRGRG